MVQDWIKGEIARSRRQRAALLNVLNALYRFGATPVGQAKLARESGLANNTVAAGYIEVLNDLFRSVEDFLVLPETIQSIWYEWLVAQELLLRLAICGEEILLLLAFWRNPSHEIDFVTTKENFIEVKPGGASALEFRWFIKQFPGKNLTVINQKSFDTGIIRGESLEDFLLQM